MTMATSPEPYTLVPAAHLEGALDGLVFTQVQGGDEVADLALGGLVLRVARRQLLALLREVRELVQRLLVHVAAAGARVRLRKGGGGFAMGLST